MSLLQRARSNDQEAWNQIVHLYGPLVQKWCRQASLQDDDLADVFQETFRAVSTHLKSFKPMRDVGSFRSWLRTIVRTKIADHFRRLSNQPAGQGGGLMELSESATSPIHFRILSRTTTKRKRPASIRCSSSEPWI